MRRPAYPSDRRGQILEAALSCFLARGYAATSIADIRLRSGASTGSIYHFFANKAAIAEALLDDASGGWIGLPSATPSEAASAEQMIKASVTDLVLWGLAQPAHLRFVMEIRHLAARDPELVSVRKLIARALLGNPVLYGELIARGAVRNLPWPVAQSLILGPALTWLDLNPTPAPGEGERHAALFADAAWQSVRA